MSNNGHIIGNRNSTPEASSSSSLRPPPSSRTAMAAGHQLRASADMGAFASPAGQSRANRPASEVIYNQMQQGHNRMSTDDTVDKATQQWIADIDQYEATLDEMAAAALDHEFKDELSAIEQWFKVLSEAERTAALYALLQQTTQVQIRFFIGVLQQMSKSHPTSGILSPSNFGDRDSMSTRLNSAMTKLGGDRHSLGPGRIPPTPGNKRNSGLDADQMNDMFPDAVAAIAKEKADFQEQTGTVPTSNRNSAVGDRTSLTAPTISAPREEPKREGFGAAVPPSPWRQRNTDTTAASTNRPKSSAGTQPMGQFSQPLQTAGLRSPRPFPLAGDSGLQQNTTTFNPAEIHAPGMGMLSPFLPGQSWGSLMNTPMVPNFNIQPNNQADMIAAATQAKLGAMSTINSRFQLDDVRKYRRARSTDGDHNGMGMPQQMSQGIGMGGPGIMTNQLGQALTPEQAASLQYQQLEALRGRRSPTGSPARGPMGNGMGAINVPPQQNGFLSVFDPNAMLNNGMAGMNLGHYGSDAGYLSDASDIHRGRSPRGRRGSSKPPDDPTNVELLKDIPNWLRSLRLHKYTDNLKDMNWKDLILLDEDGLEAKGVGAQGARKKMLKVFEQVREAQAQGRL